MTGGQGVSDLEQDLAFHIHAAGLPEPVREYRFHDTRRWRFDFAWPEYQVAAEVEGGVFTKGRHTRGPGFVKDCEKYNEAALLGWIVLRFPSPMISSGEALAMLERALDD
jgi:hypothetical protein